MYVGATAGVTAISVPDTHPDGSDEGENALKDCGHEIQLRWRNVVQFQKYSQAVDVREFSMLFESQPALCIKTFRTFYLMYLRYWYDRVGRSVFGRI